VSSTNFSKQKVEMLRIAEMGGLRFSVKQPILSASTKKSIHLPWNHEL
jgi:hypothetical protein